MAALILPSRRVVQPQQGYTLNQTAVKETGTFFLTFPDKTLRDAVSGLTLANPGGISFGEKGQTATFNGSQQGNLLLPIPNGHTNLIVAARIRATAAQAGTPGAAFGVYQSTAQGGFGVGFDTSNRVGLALLTTTGAYLSTYSAGVQQRWYTVYAQISGVGNGIGVVYVDGRPATTGQGVAYNGSPATPNEIAIGAQHRSSGYLRQFRGDIEWASLMYVPGETWQSLTDDVALRLYESGYPYNLITPTQRRIIVDLGAGGGGASQSVAFTLDGIAFAGTQTAGRTQSLAASLDGVSVTAAQTLQHSQSLAAGLDGVTFAASQQVAGAAGQTLAITLDDVAFNASQTLGHAQAVTALLDGISFAAAQTVAQTQKAQSLAVTLDDVSVDVVQVGADPVSGGSGFVLIDAPSKLWWKRKPRALPEEVADQKLVKVARVIERIARQQVEKQTPNEQRRIEARQVVAPLVADMPGFDWSAMYRYALDRLIEQRLAEQLAGQQAAQEIERIRIMSDEDDVLLLLMAI